jgi:hypothetical protein
MSSISETRLRRPKWSRSSKPWADPETVEDALVDAPNATAMRKRLNRRCALIAAHV